MNLRELEGTRMPDVHLPSTRGTMEPLARDGVTVFYVYPKSGRPGVEPPPGWDEEPGMKGCTAQSCRFRDHHAEIAGAGATVFGISTQTTDEQIEFSQRNDLPFALLSDPACVLERELGLPAVQVTDDLRVYRRVTLITHDARILKVFYPVIPPDANAAEVANWLLSEHAP